MIPATEMAYAYPYVQSVCSIGLIHLGIQRLRRNLIQSTNLNASSAELAKYSVQLKR